jgi:hypothetical protein
MEITQIQVSYHDQEDRIVMRINLDADKHLSLLLTRRICRFMLENLGMFLNVGASEPLLSVQLDGQSEHAAANVHAHAQDASQDDAQDARIAVDGQRGLPRSSRLPDSPLDRQTPFQERQPDGNILSTGTDIILVANASCNRGEDQLTFTFFMNGLQPVNLNLSASLATGIFQLLSDLAIKAQWFTGLLPNNPVAADQTESDAVDVKQSITYH